MYLAEVPRRMPATQQTDVFIMLEVSRDAAAAGKEILASCTAEQSKFCLIFTVASASWGRWQRFRAQF
jgi:hypothetical protein